MLLVVDVGNTNIKFGIYKDKELVFEARTATDRNKTSDQFTAEIYTLLQINKIDISHITGCALSSVVPRVTAPLVTAIKNLTNGVEPVVVGPGIKTGLNIKIDNPAATGSDLVASCVAAAAIYPCPCIIIGMGTATTMLVLDSNKSMIGGALMPGVAISLNALTSTSALLPAVALDAPEKTIGKNNDECMRSGLVFGTACMLDGMIEKIENELGQSCTVVATGGIAPTIISSCQRNIILRDDLILEGLRIIHGKNT